MHCVRERLMNFQIFVICLWMKPFFHAVAKNRARSIHGNWISRRWSRHGRATVTYGAGRRTLITHHCQSTVLCTRLRRKTNMDAPFRCVWTWRPILRSTPKPTPCSRLRPNAWPSGHFVKWEHCERFSGGLKGEMPRTGHRRRRGVDNGEGCPHPQPTSESELCQHGPGSELQPETNLVILLLRVLY